MNEFFSLLFLTAFSSVKFLFSAPLAILQYKLPYWQAVMYTTAGGGTGVVVFAYLSKQIDQYCQMLLKVFFKRKQFATKRKFTFRNRVIIKIKQKYGLPGLLLFTPSLLSIPVGSFLAQRYFPGSKTIFLLVASVFIWSLFLNAIYAFFI